MQHSGKKRAITRLDYVRGKGFLAVAHHEAGHAIVEWAAGVDPGRVVIYPVLGLLATGGSYGQHIPSRQPSAPEHLVGLYAGHTAELLWVNNNIESEDERAHADSCLEEGRTNDESAAASLLQENGLQSRETEFRELARRVVVRHWEHIETVAGALVSGLARIDGNELEVAPLLPERPTPRGLFP